MKNLPMNMNVQIKFLLKHREKIVDGEIHSLKYSLRRDHIMNENDFITFMKENNLPTDNFDMVETEVIYNKESIEFILKFWDIRSSDKERLVSRKDIIIGITPKHNEESNESFLRNNYPNVVINSFHQILSKIILSFIVKKKIPGYKIPYIENEDSTKYKTIYFDDDENKIEKENNK